MVSVIIPLYNVEKYIKWCLLSFENQAYKDFELIIVNDGSKDESVSIVEKYISESKMKIYLIHQENTGVSAARNKGIEYSKGRYICFVDSDDMVAPDYLSDMVKTLESEVCQMVICGVKNIPEESCKVSHYLNKECIVKFNSHEVLKKFLYRDISPGVWSLIVRREILEKNKLRFANGYRYSEDIELIFKMIAECNDIAFLEHPLYLYRVRDTSVMSLVDDKRMDGFKLMKGLESYFDSTYPNFAQEFKKFGVARWVWATLWQSAIAGENFKEFANNYKMYNTDLYIKKLIFFPRVKVSITSFMFFISPYLYFNFIRLVGKKKLNNRTLHTQNKNG